MIRSIPTIASLTALRVAFAALEAGARAANKLALLRDARRVERAARAAEREAARSERFAEVPSVDSIAAVIERARREVERAENAAQAARADVERMRETLAEAIAQREEAKEKATAGWGKYITAMESYLAQAERYKQERADAAQNLSAAQAVIADLRRDLATQHADHQRWMAGMLAEHVAAHEALRAVDAERKAVRDELGAVAEETAADGIECLRAILGAREDETALRAAERVVRECDAREVQARRFREDLVDAIPLCVSDGKLPSGESQTIILRAVQNLANAAQRLSDVDAALGSEGEPLQCVHAMLRMLDAAEGETLLAAVHRATQAVSHG